MKKKDGVTYGDIKKLRLEHKEKQGEKALTYMAFYNRLYSGWDVKVAINTPNRGHGGSIYSGRHKGKKIKYNIVNKY